jgi:hypothetical protein
MAGGLEVALDCVEQALAHPRKLNPRADMALGKVIGHAPGVMSDFSCRCNNSGVLHIWLHMQLYRTQQMESP